MSGSRPILIVIVGPTAVGKTALAIQLAQKWQTNIVSADSRQFYKEMEIGTAKPSPEELDAVKHYFINSHGIDTPYNAAQYGSDALAIIHKEFENRNKLVMVGGSGLYVRAVCDGLDEIPAIDEKIRKSLQSEFESQGIVGLQNKMKELDPVYFEVIDQNNPVRLIRALEVKIGTGLSLQSYQGKRKVTHDFNMIKIGLDLPREELYQRIDYRIDEMIDKGLFEEASRLFDKRDLMALRTVGYQEVFGYLEGEYDYAEAVRLLKRNSRRYAKRQLTWFNADDKVNWFHPNQINQIVDFIIKETTR